MGRRHKPHLRCATCRLHASLCICGLLPRIDTRTRVVLIMHQLEARKPTNTGLIAARCLPNSAIGYRGRAPSDAEGPEVDSRRGRSSFAGPSPSREVRNPSEGSEVEVDWATLVPAGSRALILYPHDGATPIGAFRDSPSPLTLVVPDGTWRQAARTRTRLAASLGGGASAPCVTVAAPTATARVARRLRTGARPERLATLEALALALGVLEGPDVEAQLLHVFRVMTERTLWTNGRVPASAVTGGIPAGVRSHDPLGTRGAS